MAKIIYIRKFPLKGGFIAINLFGVIFSVQKLDKVELNHELIHTAQQRELLFVGFYIWYLIEWACLCFKYHDYIEAYRHIRFEREAYNHQYDLGYLAKRLHFNYK